MIKMIPAMLAVMLSGPALAADGFWTGAATKAEAPKAEAPKAETKPETKLEIPKAPPAPTPGLPGIEALEAALADVWEKTPLTQRHAVFVTEKPEIYGGFSERPSRSFASTETLLTYVEPVGYTWTPRGDGRFAFGFSLDFKVKTPNGKILAGQDNFQGFDFTSRFKNREVFMTLNMTLNGIEPGAYVLVYTLHDKGSDKVSSFEQPFTIAN